MAKKEKTIYGLIGSILLLVLVVGTSYAYIKYDEKEAGYNVVGTNCIKIILQDKSTEINLKNAYPVEDEVGKTSKPYQFSITNECDVPVTYQVNLEVHQESSIDAGNIAVLFDNATEKHILGTDDTATPIEADDKDDIKESHKVGEGNVRGHETVYHEVRLWLDKDATNETQDKIFKCRVAIEAIQNPLANYKEELLNGADPVLDTEGELIPVKIDESGTVKKADPSKEWYKYEHQQWANAVILNENGKSKTFAYEEVIPEDDIESYFVWIPKYSYKLFDENLGNYNGLVTTTTPKEQVIEIQFGLRNTINSLTECETPMNEERTQGLSGESGSCTKDKWMTHPAFISFDVNGIWVGKFETSTPGSNKIEIKPNKTSWHNMAVGNMFNTSKNYKTDLLSHMMKNTEWGAVAYLTQSIYGRCNTNQCNEILSNNNSNFITGFGTTTKPTIGFPSFKAFENISPNQNGSITFNYLNPLSVAASTTDNYTGIYDMSGGNWEYVMGVMTTATSISQVSINNIVVGQSGLTTKDIPDLRYADLYIKGTEYQYSRRILGDATGEIGPFVNQYYDGSTNRERGSWNFDLGWFANEAGPIIDRGGRYDGGLENGLFAFGYTNGASAWSFRIVLAVR